MSSSKQIPFYRRIAVSVDGSKSIFYAEKIMLAQRKKTSLSTWFPDEEIFCERTRSTDCQEIHPKIFGNYPFTENFLTRKLGMKKNFEKELTYSY